MNTQQLTDRLNALLDLSRYADARIAGRSQYAVMIRDLFGGESGRRATKQLNDTVAAKQRILRAAMNTADKLKQSIYEDIQAQVRAQNRCSSVERTA